MLGAFKNTDCRLNASNIPHPYPLLPDSVPAPAPTKKSLFSGKKKDKVRESRVAHAYAEASNAFKLDRYMSENELAQAFVRFEKADQPGNVDPREARRERWLIIYCVLQTLAGISVDVPHLSFKGDVSYFLNTRLQGLPPWSPREKLFIEAAREQSHCWISPKTWADNDFDRWESLKGVDPNSKSEDVSDSRPLSPESQTSSFAFFDSTHHTPIGELEANDLFRKGYDSPVTEPSTISEGSNPPEYRVVTSKFAATTGISEYSKKPLPLRPGAGITRDPGFNRRKR